jgi:hypothetical protein
MEVEMNWKGRVIYEIFLSETVKGGDHLGILVEIDNIKIGHRKSGP